MDFIFLCSIASELRNNDIYQTVTRCLRTGVLRARDVSMENRLAFRAEMKGCMLDIGL